MFADPQTVVIGGVDWDLVKINQDAYSSEYLLRSSTDEARLRIRNTTYFDKKRGVSVDRHNVEFIQTIFPVAPATLAHVRKQYFVIENQQGDTLANSIACGKALCDWLTANTSAALTALMNFES